MTLLVTGCASAPSQEMSDARQALQAAVAVGAEALVTPDVERARNFLSSAESALALKQYDRARNGAVAAKRAALWARRVAVEIRDAQAELRRATAAGVFVPEAGDALQQAKAAAQAGRATQALEHASRASALAKSAQVKIGG